MESMRRRLLVRMAATVLILIVPASAVFWVSPSAVQQGIDDISCHGRFIGIGDTLPDCRDPASAQLAGNDFNYANAVALQAHALSINQLFDQWHR
jgi:hypothetical protein